MDEFLASGEAADRSCVIAEIHMPGDGGLALPKKIAARGLDCPVIFLCARNTRADRLAAKCADAAGYLRKPVDGEDLLDAIEWALCEGGFSRQWPLVAHPG